VAERVTVADLLDAYLSHLKTRGAKGVSASRSHLRPVYEILGEMRAVEVTSERVREFLATLSKTKCRGGGLYAPATVNRMTEALRAAFNLARKEDRLGRVPYFPRLHEDNVRRGFFERADFEAVVAALPEPECDVARFGYLTGWRLGEILPLAWERVDLGAGFVYLWESKNGEPRTMPLDPDLRALLTRRWEARRFTRGDGTEAISGFVFHVNGCRLWRLRSWIGACNEAGVPGKLFHDLRRTAVRDMIRAGVPQAVAMARTGHKTDAIFRRYNITSGTDLLDAAERLAAYRATLPAMSNVVRFAPKA
jgi:integrase